MPSNTTSSVLFHYVYVLESVKENNRYIGYTNNLKRRLEEHRTGCEDGQSYRIKADLETNSAALASSIKGSFYNNNGGCNGQGYCVGVGTCGGW